MSRSYWLFIVAVAGCIALACILGLFLQPEQPNLASDRGYREQSASYQAGGTDCQPATFATLTGRKRRAKADACAEAEEQHREATDNVIETRRAASAADASAIVAYQQARISAWGFGAGIVTLLAAIAAAVFAERAAFHTMRSANIAKTSSQRQLRAYVSITFDKMHVDLEDGSAKLSLNLHNRGLTPAYNCNTTGNIIVADYEIFYDFMVNGLTCPPKSPSI